MTNCPACRRELPPAAVECPACGVVLAKWQARPARTATASLQTAAKAGGEASGSARRLGGVAVVGIVLGLAVVAVYWYAKIRPRQRLIDNPYADAAPVAARAVAGRPDPGALFDLSIDLPGDPYNAVWTGDRFYLGNRRDPWGLIEIRPERGRSWRARKLPLVEPTHSQKMDIRALAWNGSELVAYVDGAWFQSDGHYFVRLDPDTLRVQDRVEAPERLGCLAWDGSGYWASTRRDTADADQEVHLYRFDRRLREQTRYPAPGVGCQGLAWDGQRLWFADVFSDRLLVLAVEGGAPRAKSGDELQFRYLSGVAWDGTSIWITEYEHHRLHRLNPILQRAWTGGGAVVETPEVEPAEPGIEVEVGVETAP